MFMPMIKPKHFSFKNSVVKQTAITFFASLFENRLFSGFFLDFVINGQCVLYENLCSVHRNTKN